MYTFYILRIFSSYLMIVGLLMLLRTDVFIRQFQALAHEPSLLFTLGFLGLVLGLSLALARPLSWIARCLGMLIIIKGLLCIAFPSEFAAWMTQFANPLFIYTNGISLIIFALILFVYQHYLSMQQHGKK